MKMMETIRPSKLSMEGNLELMMEPLHNSVRVRMEGSSRRVSLQSADHTALVNWAPRSEIITDGTLNRGIHEHRRNH